MRADNSDALRQAAKERRQATFDRARTALRRLEGSGGPVTFDIVAREAGVSRAWLYAEPDVRETITRLRESTGRAARSSGTALGDRASDASLLQRLEAANARNRQLSEQVRRLRDELARTHGDLRFLRLSTHGNNSGAKATSAGGGD